MSKKTSTILILIGSVILSFITFAVFKKVGLSVRDIK